MTLASPNYNPLQNYVGIGANPEMTTDGIIVDGVYAYTGVINSLQGTTSTVYQDPSSNQISSTSQTPSLQNTTTVPWISNPVDDVYNTGYTLQFNFNQPTYINYVTFDILNVPCSWTLTQSGTYNSILDQGVITGLDASWQTVTSTWAETNYFDSNTSLVLTLNKTIGNGLIYTLGVQNLLTKLQVETYSDLIVNGTTISGFTIQNSLGFVENYSLSTNSTANITNTDSSVYWKSSPQPVGDAVVYFIVDLGFQQTINKMFFDPLYSGNTLNLYYSNDCINWSPVLQDYTVRRGIYDLVTINARYIKFEFTQLTPEPYNLPFDSIQRTINVFPDSVDNYFVQLESTILDVPNQGYLPNTTNPTPTIAYNTTPSTPTAYGLAVNQLSSANYGGTPQISASQLGSSTYGVSTTSYTITDPTISYKTLQDVANIGSVFANVDAFILMNRRFTNYGPHVYKQIIINQTWHEAYFTGVKALAFYCFNPLVQNDNEDFTDSFYATISGTVIEPSPNTLVDVTNTTLTLQSGGGYSGSASSYFQTQALTTTNQFGGFYFGALNTDWQPFLTQNQTLLDGTYRSLGITVSSGITVTNIAPSTVGYGIYVISGSSGTSSLQSAIGGSANLMNTQMANFKSGGWSGGPNVTGNSTSISGNSLVEINYLTNTSNNNAYGNSPYGNASYGGAPSFASINNNYEFWITISGHGAVTYFVDYLSPSGSTVSVSSGTVNVNSASTVISGLSSQPFGSSQVKFQLTTSGTLTLSQAGFFSGTVSTWTNPLYASNMRISAVARIYLPSTNYGTYTCQLYQANGTLVAQKSYNNIPVRTWVDVEVPYVLPNGQNYSQFYVVLQQTFGAGEVYECAMLGMFYNPVAYQFSIDNTNWFPISIGVNDSNTVINTPSLTQQLWVKGTIVEDGTVVNAIDIVPVYTQTPYYSSTPINYLSNPKVGQLTNRTTVQQKPLFQLSTELHPMAYDIQQVMGVNNQFSLD